MGNQEAWAIGVFIGKLRNVIREVHLAFLPANGFCFNQHLLRLRLAHLQGTGASGSESIAVERMNG
jgi:hypothetical protein